MSKSRFSMTIAAAGICTLSGALLPAMAEAVPFQITRSSQSCGTQSLCNLPLATIPGGRTLEVKSVSCRYLISTQTVEPLQASFDVRNGSGQVVFNEYVVPEFMGRNSLGTYFSLSQPTTFFVVGPNSVSAQLATDTIAGMFMTCSVAGNLTP